MNAQANFDFKEWVQKMIPFIIMGCVVVIGAMALNAYFGYSSFQMLRDGTFQAVEIAATSLPPSPI